MKKFQKKYFRQPISFFLIGFTVGSAFGLYLWSLYRQLDEAFSVAEPFTPTRIYSDVFPIKPWALRKDIEDTLRHLGYTYTHHENSIHFKLHPLAYPSYLIPDQHPLLTITARNAEPDVELSFDLSPKHSRLKSIRIDQQEVNDLYLEPEMIAILSKTNLSKPGTSPGIAKKEIRTFLKFDEMPAPVWKAIIAIEDQHYLEHKGLDPRGIARALWVNLKTLSFAQGGSTITQQLVKNLLARRSKNIFQKANEVVLSLLLEARFDKEEILERYLNEVYLGQIGNLEIHGIAEGAEHFFGKKIQDLNLSEIALIAGLIRGPGFYSPYRHKARALERQKLVLEKMVETGQIAQGEAQAALRLPLRLRPPQNAAIKSPFFVDYVKSELGRILKNNKEDGLKIYTTLDPKLNQIAQDAVSDGILRLEQRLSQHVKLDASQRLEGALASVDHTTGRIRALVGGRNYAVSNFNRILNMRRQVGSTFKPFIYLAALKKGKDPKGIPYGPGYPLFDAPWTLIYDRGKQKWSPKNIDNTHQGWTTFRDALAFSINICAARLGMEVGLETIRDTAVSLGIESPLPLLPSLTLGIAELNPIELLQAYSTIANNGVRQELQVIRGITLADGRDYLHITSGLTPPAQQVADPAIMHLLTDMLESVFKFGTARSAAKLGFDRTAAGKTGTTSAYRDAWFAGYTPQLTTVVWVGMDQYLPDSSSEQKSSPKRSEIKLTGANSALPIWVSYMKKALENEPYPKFEPSSSLLKTVEIDRHTGKAAAAGCPQSQILIEKYIDGPNFSDASKDKSCEAHRPVISSETIME